MNQAAPRSEPLWQTSPSHFAPEMIAMEKSAARAVPRGHRRIDKGEPQGRGPAFRPSGCLGPSNHFQRGTCNTGAIQCASLCPLAKASLVDEAGASARQYSLVSPLLKDCDLRRQELAGPTGLLIRQQVMPASV